MVSVYRIFQVSGVARARANHALTIPGRGTRMSKKSGKIRDETEVTDRVPQGRIRRANRLERPRTGRDTGEDRRAAQHDFPQPHVVFGKRGTGSSSPCGRAATRGERTSRTGKAAAKELGHIKFRRDAPKKRRSIAGASFAYQQDQIILQTTGRELPKSVPPSPSPRC